jgi:thiol-disulfide isomerase/thioredoxin
VVTAVGAEIPFRFEITGDDDHLAGSFIDGDPLVVSSGGGMDGDRLTLVFDEYATTLTATWKGDELTGMYDRGTRGPGYPFRATRAPATRPEVKDVPQIAGDWRILTGKTSGERAWRFVVRQNGPEISAAILRVDGDTGTLTGRYDGSRFVLSHFTGTRPARYDVTVEPDGQLVVVENSKTRMTALRESDPRAASAPLPTNPAAHTSVKASGERFHFSFPALDGALVTDADPRFQGKVVLVNITGSWCPNCHDEAPFLGELYRTYHDRGLEIVGLAFEEAAQLKDPVRLKSFIARYKVAYPVLLVGTPDELAARLPQAENLDSFPTTFALGRDGRVREVRAGFAGRATGKLHDQVKREMTALVERLLDEPAS